MGTQTHPPQCRIGFGPRVRVCVLRHFSFSGPKGQNSTARLAGPGIAVRQNGGLKGRDPLIAPLQGASPSCIGPGPASRAMAFSRLWRSGRPYLDAHALRGREAERSRGTTKWPRCSSAPMPATARACCAKNTGLFRAGSQEFLDQFCDFLRGRPTQVFLEVGGDFR